MNINHTRSPLQVGAYVICILAIIAAGVLCCSASRKHENQKNTKSVIEETTTVWTSATTTSSTTTTTKSSTTTTTTTTATTTSTTTTVTTVVTEPPTDPPTEPPAPDPQPQPQPEPQPEPEPVYIETNYSYSESDAVLLAQLINKEASVNYSGKLAVASCVINRANINGLTISQVIYAPGQFTTAYSLGYYSQDDYNAAVEVLTNGSTDSRIYYFDGCHGGLNWFYDSYHNYLYAA